MTLLESVGDGAPGLRGQADNRPEQGALESNEAFQALVARLGGEPGPMDGWNPPAAEKASEPFHGVKTAWHAHDRMEERTPFHRSHVDHLQRSIDTLQLSPGVYHLPLRNKDGSIAGFAQFKPVPNRKYPVLATILGPEMTPGGVNLDLMLKFAMEPEMNAYPCASSLFDTDSEYALRGPDSSAWRGPAQRVGLQAPLAREILLGFGQMAARPHGDVLDANPPSPDDGKP